MRSNQRVHEGESGPDRLEALFEIIARLDREGNYDVSHGTLDDISGHVGSAIGDAYSAGHEIHRDPQHHSAAETRFLGRIRTFAEMLTVLSDLTDDRIREYLGSTLRVQVESGQSDSIASNPLLNERDRKVLATPQGRFEFDVRTFNQLCNENQFGLSKREKVPLDIAPEAFYVHQNWVLDEERQKQYHDVCGQFDGRGVREMLELAAEIVTETNDAELLPIAIDRRMIRAQERAGLMEEISSDAAHGETHLTHGGKMSPLTRLLYGRGADLALKVGAVLLLSHDPSGATLVASFSLWNSRAVVESAGLPFAETVRKVTNGAMAITSLTVFRPVIFALEKVFPGSDVVAELKAGNDKDFAESRAIAQQPLPRRPILSLTSGDRIRFLLRSMVAVTPFSPLMGPAKPSPQLHAHGDDGHYYALPAHGHSEAPAHSTNKRAIEKACRLALVSLRGKYAPTTSAK